MRRATREVAVGSVVLGGNHPVRIQSMTTTNTLDLDATVKQTLDLAEAGCEIVRITAPNAQSAESLGRRLLEHYPALAVRTGSNDPDGFDVVVKYFDNSE